MIETSILPPRSKETDEGLGLLGEVGEDSLREGSRRKKRMENKCYLVMQRALSSGKKVSQVVALPSPVMTLSSGNVLYNIDFPHKQGGYSFF